MPVEVLETALDGYEAVPSTMCLAVRESLVTANLALSPLSDFVFPALGIVNAALV